MDRNSGDLIENLIDIRNELGRIADALENMNVKKKETVEPKSECCGGHEHG